MLADFDWDGFEDALVDGVVSAVRSTVVALKPGTGYCEIDIDEVDEAVRGLSSPYAIVRQHAVGVLGDRSLGAGVARTVLPLLAQIIGRDANANVRRLAILSLLWWRNDSRPYTEVIRAAMNDPAEEVRTTAAYWLHDQDTNPGR